MTQSRADNRARQKEAGNECQMVKWDGGVQKKKKSRGTLMVLGLLWVSERWQGKRGGEIEWRVCVCEVAGGVWPVLVPPPLLSSQPSSLPSLPVSGSLPPPPADFSLGGSGKNCPLSLSPTAAARALPCPPDINQHTLCQARTRALPSELLWRTGWWAAVSSPGPHLQMRHPTS